MRKTKNFISVNIGYPCGYSNYEEFRPDNKYGNTKLYLSYSLELMIRQLYLRKKFVLPNFFVSFLAFPLKQIINKCLRVLFLI